MDTVGHAVDHQQVDEQEREDERQEATQAHPAPRCRRSRLRRPPTRSPGFAAATTDDGLRGRQAGDRHPERRARHVVEPGLVEEGDGLGVAAVLTADAELQVLASGTTALRTDPDQLADARLVDGLERVALQQTRARGRPASSGSRRRPG